MIYSEKNRGFTLIEVLVSIAILTILSIVIASGFIDFFHKNILDRETQSVISVLVVARSKALASEDSSDYGVNFSGNTMTIFKGMSYNASDSSNVNINIDSRISVSSLSLNGGGTAVKFERLKGSTSQYGSITMSDLSGSSLHKTITIYKTGLVKQND